MGHLEYKLCEFLHTTPMDLGTIRHKDPLGMAFLERHMIWESKEKEKHYKELERKSKSRRRH